MKVNLLFICANMSVGGFQKSLINLLEYMSYDKYDVDVLLIHKEGIFLNYLSNNVNILSFNDIADYFYSYPIAIKKLIKSLKFGLAIMRSVNLIISLIDKGYGAIFMSKMLPRIDKEYDVCVDYGGQFQNYYMIDKIRAKKKITYFHSDYGKWDKYCQADKIYYPKADWIVTVSEECVNAMKRYFPDCSRKIVCIENIITRRCLEKFMSSDTNISFLRHRENIIITVGRVCHDKGIDIAIDVAQMLKKELGNNFIWVWIGPSDSRLDYVQEVDKKKLSDNFVFTGAQIDPYSYMKLADVYVQPSRFEGKAVSVEEALVLNIPVVATDFSTVHDQISEGNNGFITSFENENIKNAIIKLLTDKSLNQKIRNYQKEHHQGNANEINKLYALIDND